jgi:fructokinase
MSTRSTVVCFGEVLWDSTPEGLFLGGAPTNVAYHYRRLGGRSVLVSAVGDDWLGEEVRRRLYAWGVTTDNIGTVMNKQTGVVEVDLTNPNNPNYEIVDDVAWDYIPDTDGVIREASSADVFVFGSLALRRGSNQALLNKLLHASTGLKIFDVNLRPPFFDRSHVLSLARRADLVKLNESELEVLHPLAVGSLEVMASAFSELIGHKKVCVTCGSQGAGYWSGHDWLWEEARPVKAHGNAIGAGDAFLAALAIELATGRPASEALKRACRLAEYVASAGGAQPNYDPNFLYSGADS